jgi:putative aldouronate transport system permease protein
MTFSKDKPGVIKKAVKKKKFRREGFVLTMLALPFVVFVFAFNYVPLFGWIYAFFDYKPGVPLFNSTFVGFKYFQLMFNDGGDMFRVMKNTLVMSFLMLLFSPLPVIFAIMITEARSKFFRKFIQTTTTLPNFISWVIVFSLAFSIFSSDGVVNTMLLKLHLISQPTNILGNNDAVWYFQTALGIWKSLGWSAIIYLAAIAGIDSELYDAASVDGAGRFARIRHITLPGISETFIVLLLLSASSVLSLGLDQYLVFYNSMVAKNIEVIDYYVYRLGLLSNDYSYATAIGIFKTVVSVALLFSINGLSKKIRGNSLI